MFLDPRWLPNVNVTCVLLGKLGMNPTAAPMVDSKYIGFVMSVNGAGAGQKKKKNPNKLFSRHVRKV